METREIKIQVDADTARLYNGASLQEKRKMNLLLSLRLKEFTSNIPSLKKIMCEISKKAQVKGLTEEKLNQLLREE